MEVTQGQKGGSNYYWMDTLTHVQQEAGISLWRLYTILKCYLGGLCPKGVLHWIHKKVVFYQKYQRILFFKHFNISGVSFYNYK